MKFVERRDTRRISDKTYRKFLSVKTCEDAEKTNKSGTIKKSNDLMVVMSLFTFHLHQIHDAIIF